MFELYKRFILIRARIRKKLIHALARLKAYIKRFLFPLYLFPVKIGTYSAFYLVRFSLALTFKVIVLAVLALIWPLRSWGNALRTVIGAALIVYLFFSFLVIADYMNDHYGGFSKFFCGQSPTTKKLKSSVVRVVGGYSEGSGFFIDESRVVTNFHVIDGEPSPKIIFPNGNFITPKKIMGSKTADIAVLYTDGEYPDKVIPIPEVLKMTENEPLLAVGYALGSSLAGGPTIERGTIVAPRKSRKDPVQYLQATIDLVPGMSGGPLVDSCGNLIGINTMGLSGLSLFIAAGEISSLEPTFSEQDIVPIKVDSGTPEGAVAAYYTYLKARRMEDGFKLLSQAYLKKTNFGEWTTRFKDILDVQVFGTKLMDKRKQIVFVKFATKNWVDGEAETHFYEGTWQTILENGIYKMYKSNIKEISEPSFNWFYEI